MRITMGISALSYIEIPNKVPGLELLFQTADKQTRDYVTNLGTSKTVYAIKRYPDRYEHEIYHYTYDPKRPSPLVLTHDDTFPEVPSFISNCALFQTNFIIVSYDLNKAFFEHGPSDINFYYERRNAPGYPYFVLEESKEGIIRQTNNYGLIKTSMKFSEPGGIMFYAEKPLKKTSCVYYENMSRGKFLEFLEFFKYDPKLIDFCRTKYDDTYKFCVSYDYDENSKIIKTTIFSTIDFSKEVFNADGTEQKYPQFDESFFPISLYPQLDIITRNYDMILKEVQDIRHKDPAMWHEWIDGTLNVFPLYFFGKWCKKALALCPELYELVKDIPDVQTISVSCLKPDKVIQPHMGWGDLANNILRCHFGIDVPENCGCVCDNWVVPHRNGQWLIFDDSKMHTSFNYSDRNRYILIIDMKRPESVPKGTCTVAYSQNLLDFIEGFYDSDEIGEIRERLGVAPGYPVESPEV